MIIESLAARAVNVPLEYPVRTSVGTVATAPLVLIDIATDAGFVGRSYVFTYTPLALAAMREMLASLGGILAGQPAAPAEIDRLLEGRFRLLGATGLVRMAMAGIDMALWDAAAQKLGVPLVEMLGGRRRPIPAYDSHSMDGEALAVERAAKAAGQGYTAIKTKVGYPSLAEDIGVVRAIRKAVGDGVRILADYNQSLSVPEAIRRGKALEDEGVAWLEEPTRQEDYLGHARIRQALNIPVQMGENWFGVDEMTRALDAGATALAMPDAMKIGGVTGWLRAAALAQSRGIPMSSHIFQEVSCHLMAVTPTAHLLERMDLAAPILEEPLKFEAGCAIIPEQPGTGIRWNEEAVRRYAH
ncbi:Mandelate racemase [Magnetospirillum sp. XM-1]|uniref:enolase C-terminal domain-like protein n=1 Tax=Magnetospirillum sp. XM-1 TaxID=1663591 RepID=UPI00073DEA25|nr:enolase C-terminal domain-like protein [Magnetospirillum sp. XM-1]CUW41626.1 Mandelate racemase [Magnetospirillum sp. XM-1]